MSKKRRPLNERLKEQVAKLETKLAAKQEEVQLRNKLAELKAKDAQHSRKKARRRSRGA